jgi:hypothetical protein
VRSPPPGQRILAAGLFFALATLVGTWPVFSRPWTAIYDPAPPATDPQLAGFIAGKRLVLPTEAPSKQASPWGYLTRADSLLNIWTLAWGAHALASDPGRFLDANTLFPTPRALTYSDHQLGVLPWFAPTYWLTGNPVLAYQGALFLSAVTCGLCFFLLVHGWTSSTSAALLAGVVSIFAPFHLASLHVLIHYAIQYVPAALLCVDALVAGRRRVLAAIGLSACLVLQAACSVYMVYATFLLVPAYALGVLLESRTPGRGRALAWIVVAGLIAAALVVVVYRPYLVHVESGQFTPGGAQRPLPYDPWLVISWLSPASTQGRLLGMTLGLPLLALALLGVLHARSRRRWTVLGLVFFGVVLALGPELRFEAISVPLPWSWFARRVPGFATQRHLYVPRLLVGVGLICLVGLGWAWLVTRLGRAARWVGPLVALGLVAGTLYQFAPERPRILRVATGADVPDVYRWLAAHGGGEPLLELPARIGVNTAYAYYSTYHWLPLFNGGYAIAPRGYGERARRAFDVLSPKGEAFLDEVPVGWVLVHGGFLYPMHDGAMNHPPPHLEEAARFGMDVLFRVRRTPR